MEEASNEKKIYLDRLKIRRAMRRKGYWTFVDLSRAMGVHKFSLLRRLTRTQVGSFDVRFLERLADALDCHPTDLISAVGYPPPRIPHDPQSPWPSPPRRGRLPLDFGNGNDKNDKEVAA